MKSKSIKETKTMARPQENTKLSLPNPESSNGGKLAPFLKPEDLPNSKRVKLQILGRPRPGSSRYGEGIIIDAKLGNKEYALSVKFRSHNYARLFDKFGDDPPAWKGTVEVERANYLGKDYVKVV
jgi:hypothetical protein